MGKPNSIKVKSISFNLHDPMQRKLYDHAIMNSKNFSSYIKTLISMDIRDIDSPPLPHEESVSDFEYMDHVL